MFHNLYALALLQKRLTIISYEWEVVKGTKHSDFNVSSDNVTLGTFTQDTGRVPRHTPSKRWSSVHQGTQARKLSDTVNSLCILCNAIGTNKTLQQQLNKHKSPLQQHLNKNKSLHSNIYNT